MLLPNDPFPKLTVGSLFAGIGGIDRGLEMTGGFKTVWQCEKDDYARRVLEKHWPDVRRWDDVRTFPPDGEWFANVICGGFPCTGISEAGLKRGLDDDASGLWRDFRRVLGILRPQFGIVENSSALPIRGLHRVAGDLAGIGYDAEWQIISARAAGAPHLRRRTFIVCYPNGSRWAPILDTAAYKEWALSRHGTWWDAEPGVCRVVTRTSIVVDRLRCLGNSVVPQVAEFIGRMILDAVRTE